MKRTDQSRSGRYTFHILEANGRRKHGLLRSFIKELTLSYTDTVIRLDDDEQTQWALYAEDNVLDTLGNALSVKCVVSFQSYKDGEMIAVARLWRPRKAVTSKPHTIYVGHPAQMKPIRGA